METFSALLALCAANSPVSGEFSTEGPVTRSFDVFFDLCLNKRLSKQSLGWWSETPSRLSWRHCNDWQNIIVIWAWMRLKLLATNRWNALFFVWIHNVLFLTDIRMTSCERHAWRFLHKMSVKPQTYRVVNALYSHIYLWYKILPRWKSVLETCTWSCRAGTFRLCNKRVSSI